MHWSTQRGLEEFNPIDFLKLLLHKNTENLTQSNPMQSMDGSNPCPTLIKLDEKLHEIWSVYSQKDH